MLRILVLTLSLDNEGLAKRALEQLLDLLEAGGPEEVGVGRLVDGHDVKVVERGEEARPFGVALPAPHADGAIRAAADGPLKGILGYTDTANVSCDFNHDPRSSIFHMDQTKVMEGQMCRILTWYDNEWGFSNRMSDTAVAMAALI